MISLISAFLISLLSIGAASSVLLDDAFGSVQLLYQNDLTSDSNSTSAFLLHKKRTYEDVVNSCTALSESPLLAVPPDIEDQLRYLTFSGQLANNTLLYIAAPAGRFHQTRSRHKQTCRAYSLEQKAIVEVDCHTQLAGLCTQSAGPFTASQLETAVAPWKEVAVKSGDYSLTGFRDERSFHFLGIPFAEPPLGRLRFAPPLPYNGTKAIIATRAGKACIQATGPFVPSFDEMGEDCLNLNVFTSYIPSGSFASVPLKPVLVWIYGGSYIEGWADQPDYDGGNLVSRGDVVVVALNYRVGALGTLTTQTSLHGSQAIQDQILALEWVHEHISDFGGDPSRVTIFGQSAGGQSVYAQLSSSASKGLFSSAIGESPLLGVSFVTRDLNSQFITPAVAHATNCTTRTESDMISCLRSLPAFTFVEPNVTDIVTAAAIKALLLFDETPTGLAEAEPYLPVTAASGGPPGVIDDQFQYLTGNGTLPNPVPFMIGTMRDEAGLFIPVFPGLEQPLPTTEKAFLEVLENGSVVPNSTVQAIISSGLFPLNTSNIDGVRNELVDIVTSYAWQCPWQQQLQLAVERKTFPKLFSYNFDLGMPQIDTYPARCFPGDPLGQWICHANDINEVWGRSDVIGAPYNQTNSLAFSQYVMDTWLAFASTHDPQPAQQYLLARGSAYNSTAHLSAIAPFLEYSATKDGLIHHLDLPPYNAGPRYPQKCKMYEASGGYTHDRINNAL